MCISVTWEEWLPNAEVRSSRGTSRRRYCDEGVFRRDATLPGSAGFRTEDLAHERCCEAPRPVAALAGAPGRRDAQTEADRESVTKVIEQLFNTAGEDKDGLARIPETWSVAIARFAKGDSREIEIPAKVGETYQVIGGSESDDTDVDICVYGPDGDQIDCDTMQDKLPRRDIRGTVGTYRAV